MNRKGYVNLETDYNKRNLNRMSYSRFLVPSFALDSVRIVNVKMMCVCKLLEGISVFNVLLFWDLNGYLLRLEFWGLPLC